MLLINNKKNSMIRKCHNHTLQTIPRHREEEQQNTNRNKTWSNIKQLALSSPSKW